MATSLSSLDLLTDTNSTIFSELEETTSKIVEHCQLSSESDVSTPHTDDAQHYAVKFASNDQTTQHPDDMESKIQQNLSGTADHLQNLVSSTPFTDSQTSPVFSGSDSAEAAEMTNNLSHQRSEECSAATDRAKQQVVDLLRKHEGFQGRFLGLQNLLRHHIEVYQDAPGSEGLSYVDGFKSCLAKVESLSQVVNLPLSQDTFDLNLVFSQANETTRQVCGWVQSFAEQLTRDTETAETEMEDGWSLYENMMKAAYVVAKARRRYSIEVIAHYRYPLQGKLEAYLAGDIPKLELGGLAPGNDDVGVLFQNALKSFIEEQETSRKGDKPDPYTFMLSKGLQSALWNTSTLLSLETFAMLRRDFVPQSDQLVSAKDMFKELNTSTSSAWQKVSSTIDIIQSMNKLDTWALGNCGSEVKFLKDLKDPLEKNLDSYMKSMEMNENFYL